MDLTVALIAALVLEPLLVVVVAPRITRRMVEKDIDGIVSGKLAPAVREAATEAMREWQDEAVSDAGAELSRRGVAARQAYAMNEEKLLAACISKFGEPGRALFELAKDTFPAHFKVAVRAGPAGIEPFLGKLAAMSGGARQQQAVGWL